MKIAQTLDGYVAQDDGISQWITGESARRRVHQLRAAYTAVLVGSGTLQKDDPALTARGVDYQGVVTRIILLRTMILPDPTARLWQDKDPVWVFAHSEAQHHPAAEDAWRRLGAEVLYVDSESPVAIRRCLFQAGIARVMIEAGPGLISFALKQGMVDWIHVFVAPRWLGKGMAAVSPEVLGPPFSLTSTRDFSLLETTMHGNDVELVGWFPDIMPSTSW